MRIPICETVLEEQKIFNLLDVRSYIRIYYKSLVFFACTDCYAPYFKLLPLLTGIYHREPENRRNKEMGHGCMEWNQDVEERKNMISRQ